MQKTEESHRAISRLVLGTAQLGMRYGIANRIGIPDLAQAREIVGAANSSGINCFDTAQGYEQSENVLGMCIESLSNKPAISIISKLSPQVNFSSVKDVVDAIGISLQKLSIPFLGGLLLHRPDQMQLWHKGGLDAIYELRNKGLIRAFGISMAFSIEELLPLLENPDIAMLQIPFSIWDRRAITSRLYDAATLANKQVFVRSVFLQGLAFMHENEIPPNLVARLSPLVCAANEFCRAKGYPVCHFCLQYALSRMPGARILFGAETKEQVVANIAYATSVIPEDDFNEWDSKYSFTDITALVPSFWAK